MRRHKKHEQKAEINVVPYIDVSLVLLIVFMVTAPLMMQGVDVQLPQVSTTPLQADSEPLIVSVRQDKTLSLNLGDPEAQTSVQPLQEIVEKIAKTRANQPKTPVLIWGDARVDYGAVVEVMSALQAVGVSNVGLVTDPPSSTSKK